MGFSALASLQFACIEEDPNWLGRPDSETDSDTDDADQTGSEGDEQGADSDSDSNTAGDGSTGSGSDDSGAETGETGSDSTGHDSGETDDSGDTTDGGSDGDSGNTSDDTGNSDTGSESGSDGGDADGGGTDSGDFGDSGDSGDGGTGTGTGTDPPLTCTEAWSLSDLTLEPPEEVTEINSTSYESGISLSPDGLTIYFARYPTGSGDLYQASRPTIPDPFGSVTALSSVNTSAAEWNYVLTADNLSAFIVTDRSGGEGQTDIWVTERADPEDSFGAFSPLSEINTAGEEWDVHLSPDGLRIYWTNSTSDADNLHFATRTSRQSSFGTPQSMAIGTDTSYEDSPVLTANGLVLLFGTDESGGPGGRDIWYAVRDDIDSSFQTPQVLPSVNSSGREGELALSPDGCELYFNSDRSGGTGAWDIYRTRIILP